MKIKRFEAREVNGYLNFDINFNDRLTFLIGINGSGKTTALKLILGLLSPSWVNLTQIKYGYAQVECLTNDNDLIKIRSEYTNPEKLRLSIESEKNQELNSASTVRVQEIPVIQMTDFTRFEMRNILNKYSRYESHFIELEAVKVIRELNTPVFLGLDRRIHEGEEIDLLSIENFMQKRDLTTDIKGNLYESLLDVEKLIKDSFLDYSQKQTSISSSLKNKIIYSSFDTIQGNEDLGFALTSDIDIDSRKERIIEASKNFEIPDLETKILHYFKDLDGIQKTLKKEQLKNKPNSNDKYMKVLGQWLINSPQLERIDKIISLYEDAQQEIEKSYVLFEKFESLTNLYFAENHKKLSIKKNGEIELELPDGNKTGIYRLSSGEKQIIVMLTQLIFGEKRHTFIIDEPELSLHLGWQEIFVESLIKASPETQFIMATHSPSIIGNTSNQDFCQDLTQLK